MRIRPNRRRWIGGALAFTAAWLGDSASASARQSFPQWVESFKPKALARGISAATYDRVMGDLKPDMSVIALQQAQPEFTEETWQYINRRVSDWRLISGKE